MPKFRDRTCAICGAIEYNTATKSDICLKCHNIKKKENKRNKERQFLEDLGYSNIQEAGYSQHEAVLWSFVHDDCGTGQVWTFNNIRARRNRDFDSVPCSHCGGKRRALKALEGYLEKYGRTYDLELLEDYARKVRLLSNKTYNENLSILNPHGYIRSMTDYHLDHIVPIIICFLEKISVEAAGSIKNLQLLTAAENLSKCRSSCNEQLLEELKLLSV